MDSGFRNRALLRISPHTKPSMCPIPARTSQSNHTHARRKMAAQPAFHEQPLYGGALTVNLPTTFIDARYDERTTIAISRKRHY